MPQGQRTNPQADHLLARIDSLGRRVQRSRDDLDAASQLETLGLLTSAIAHEFNNILTPILSYARVALDTPEDTVLCHRALERAAMGAERASRIASSVLRLAGNDKSVQPAERCSPVVALRGAMACLPEPLDCSSIQLRPSLAEELYLAISQTDLEHVFLNLLLNSTRALSETGERGDGGGVIEISCRDSVSASTWNASGPGENAVTLVFKDNGPGIDPETLAGLFEPFQRTQAAPRPQSNGLGLAICRQLLDAAGGAITAESTQGQGATFLITLPVATDKPTDSTG